MKQRIKSILLVLIIAGVIVFVIHLAKIYLSLWAVEAACFLFVLWLIWSILNDDSISKERKLIGDLDSLLERMIERKENTSANELRNIMLDYVKDEEDEK